MDIITLIINLISGAVGGNIAGALLKDQSLGTLGNSIAGILGGGLGGVILQARERLPAGEDSTSALCSAISRAGVSGAES